MDRLPENRLPENRLPDAVAQYLQRAAPRNNRLRAELHGDLHQRMLDHLTAGLNEHDAWQLALREFGPPVPAWPGRVRLLLLLGMLGGSAYACAAAAHLAAL